MRFLLEKNAPRRKRIAAEPREELSAFGIDCRRVDKPFGYDFKAVLCLPPEKAASVTLVAGRAFLPHFQQDRVGVAIDENGFHLLRVATLFSLVPQLASRPAEVDGLSRGHRFRIALGVHPSHHQHFAGLSILRDRRQ